MRRDDPSLRAAQAASFGDAAEIYERARPGYPERALDWLLPQNATDVLDLGAGTGKLSRQLFARGLEVTAVEPSERMLDQLRAHVPGVTALIGHAEELPVPDDCIDAVVCAQAWHWVDVQRASAEAARVLRAGGRLGLLWNARDEHVDWMAKLGRIIEPGTSHMDLARPDIGGQFERLEHFSVPWNNPVTPSGLIDLVSSRSYVITAPEQERRRILAEVRDLLASHPDLRGRERFEMPYVTHCSRAHIA